MGSVCPASGRFAGGALVGTFPGSYPMGIRRLLAGGLYLFSIAEAVGTSSSSRSHRPFLVLSDLEVCLALNSSGGCGLDYRGQRSLSDWRNTWFGKSWHLCSRCGSGKQALLALREWDLPDA